MIVLPFEVTSDDYYTPPFTIVIDTREQRPFIFSGTGLTNRAGKILRCRTVRKALRCGDYSIEGFENRIAIERKSKEDLYQSVTWHRERFEREFYRLSELEFAAVVVEADFNRILHSPPPLSRVNPKSVEGTIVAWSVKFPKVHWFLCNGINHAASVTYRLLEKFYTLTTKGDVQDGRPSATSGSLAERQASGSERVECELPGS